MPSGRARGAELLYLAPDGRIMVVPYTAAGDAFQAEKPRVWSETPVQLRPLIGASFDLHPDGDARGDGAGRPRRRPARRT